MKDKKNQTWYFLILISIMYKRIQFQRISPHGSRSSMKISSNEYCEYCSNTEWILWEILNIVKIWFPPPCQINLSTVAKQSLHCLFAEEGKHYTAMIGFSQQSNRQINANFTPHVFRTFSNQYFQSPMKRYQNFWGILWHFAVKYEH